MIEVYRLNCHTPDFKASTYNITILRPRAPHVGLRKNGRMDAERVESDEASLIPQTRIPSLSRAAGSLRNRRHSSKTRKRGLRRPATRAQTSSAARNSVTAAIALNASDYSGGPRSDDFARQRQRQTNWATVNCTKTNSDDKRGFHRAANILRKKTLPKSKNPTRNT